MSRVKVRLADNIARVIFIEEDATKGAKLGTNLYTPDGQLGTPATVRTWLGLGGAGGTLVHGTLSELNKDDHPQYTMWAARESVKGQWDFTKPIWGADGTAALPEFTFTADPNTGIYRIAADHLGVSTGGILRWDLSTTRVIQSVPLRINTELGAEIIYPTWRGGIYMQVNPGSNPPADGVGSQIAFWESGPDGSDPFEYGMRIRHSGELNNVGDLEFYRHNNSAAGVLFLRFSRDSDQAQFGAGTASLPVMSFINDPDTGIYSPGANNVGVSTSGSLKWTFGTVSHVSTLPIRGPDQSNLLPTFAFASDTDTGMYLFGANQIGWATGAVNRLILSTTELTSNVPFQGAVGGAGSPTFSFAGDPNTGVYNVGADNLGFSAGGTLRLDISTTIVTTTLPIRGPAGLASAPVYSFTADPNTGIWNSGVDILSFATGGVTRLSLGAAGEILDAAGSAGTLGQVPSSNGAGAAWSWATGGGGGGGSLTYVNTTIPAGNTIASSAADTAFTSSYDIPASTLIVGTLVRVRAIGIFSTTGTPTLQLRIKLDGTTYVDTTAVVTPSGASNDGWLIDGTFVVQSTGLTGTVEAQGVAQLANAVFDAPRTAGVSTDTTQALTVTVTAQWGTSSASNTITLRELAIWTENAVTAQGAAPASKTYLTVADESTSLPSSRRQLAGIGAVFDDSVANRRTLNVVFPNRVWQAQPAAIGAIGGNALTTFGTITSPAIATGATVAGYMSRRRAASTTVANNACTFRWAPGDHDVYATATPAGASGFTLRTRFGIPSIVSGERFFVGVASAGIAGTADPSSLTNILAVAKDAADATLQFMYNDGAGTATKVNLGITFAAGGSYDLILSVPRGGGSCAYALTDLDTGTIVSGSVSTDLPANNVGLIYILQGSVGAVAGTAVAVDFCNLEVRYLL